MSEAQTEEIEQAVLVRRSRFSLLKLGVLAIFAWIFFGAAFGYGSEEMSFAAILVANTDLTLHEFGHMLFCSGGKGICYAGGTIFQLLVPVICISYFLLARKFFSASLLVFWLGENIINSSYYMATAIDMEGIYFSPWEGIMSKAQNPGLVTDWNYLFGSWGVLSAAPAIAQAVNILGFVVMIAAVICGIISSRPDEEEF
jgi:hypothetical protein